MSIWKDKKGRYHVGIMHGGRRVHRKLPEGATRQEAVRLKIKLSKELFRVIDLGESPDIPISQAIQRYLDEEVSHHKAARITSLKAYSLEPFVVGRSLAGIVGAAEDMARSLRREVSAATINRKLSILKRVAHLAHSKWGWLQEPLHDRITRLAGERQRHTYLSASQVSALVNNLETRAAKDAVLIAAYTGLRQSEVWAIVPENISNGTIFLGTSKNGAPRSVPILPKIAVAVRRWAKSAKPHPRTAYKDFEGARVKIGIPGLRFHDLRHTCASLLAAEGVDLGTIGAILGHASTQTTKRYAHLSLEAKRKALRKIG